LIPLETIIHHFVVLRPILIHKDPLSFQS